MRKIRMVVETSIPDTADPTEAAEKFALLGGDEAQVLTVVVAAEGTDEEQARTVAAGDSIVAALAQHFPGVYDDPEVNAEAAILLADVLGGVVSLQLATATEVEASEAVAVVVDRLQASARTSAEGLRSVLNRSMN